MKEVFGLKTGTWYRVVLKAFVNYSPVCSDTRLGLTGNLLWFYFKYMQANNQNLSLLEKIISTQ